MSTQPNFETASQGPTPSALRELALFLIENKKWWLLPIVLSMLLVSLLVVVAGSGAGPFLYTLF